MARVNNSATKISVAKNDLLKLAKRHYIFDASLNQAELIRKIQLSEGNFACYATAYSSECDQTACRWREDCLLESTCDSKVETSSAALNSRTDFPKHPVS